LINTKFIHRFLDPVNQKTAELRGRACHQFQSGDTVYLLESGLKYRVPGGRVCFRVLATARWGGCEPVDRAALPDRFSEHRATPSELRDVYPVGSVQKLYLWHFTDIRPVNDGSEVLYIEPCPADRVLLTAVLGVSESIQSFSEPGCLNCTHVPHHHLGV
jgi:hypothetical protein